MRVRFIGTDRGAGRQVAGVTYFPGDVADLAAPMARYLIGAGLAVADMPPLGAERVAVPEVEHRDPFARKARAR